MDKSNILHLRLALYILNSSMNHMNSDELAELENNLTLDDINRIHQLASVAMDIRNKIDERII